MEVLFESDISIRGTQVLTTTAHTLFRISNMLRIYKSNFIILILDFALFIVHNSMSTSTLVKHNQIIKFEAYLQQNENRETRFWRFWITGHI